MQRSLRNSITVDINPSIGHIGDSRKFIYENEESIKYENMSPEIRKQLVSNDLENTTMTLFREIVKKRFHPNFRMLDGIIFQYYGKPLFFIDKHTERGEPYYVTINIEKFKDTYEREMKLINIRKKQELYSGLIVLFLILVFILYMCILFIVF